jgi:hypothetical protein
MSILSLIERGPTHEEPEPLIGEPLSPGHSLILHPSWEVFDATKLSTFEECMRKGFFQYFLGWETDQKNHDFIFGEAGHIAHAYLTKTGYTMESVEKAFDLFLNRYRKDFAPSTDGDFGAKSPARMSDALMSYALEYRHDKFVPLYVEIADKVQIDDNLWYYFRIDSILENDNSIWARERKFTKSRPFNWGETWFLRLQPGGYAYVLEAIRGNRQSLGVEMDGTFFFPKNTEHTRALLSYTEWDLEVWRVKIVSLIDQIRRDLKQLSSEPTSLPMKAFRQNGSSCFNYNKICPFHTLCTSCKNPIQILEDHSGEPPPGFTRRWWDPTKVDEKRFSTVKEPLNLTKSNVSSISLSEFGQTGRRTRYFGKLFEENHVYNE